MTDGRVGEVVEFVWALAVPAPLALAVLPVEAEEASDSYIFTFVSK